MTKRVDFYFAEKDGKHGAECSRCGEFFTDSKGRKGNDCMQKCMDHAREKHGSLKGSFTAQPKAVA